MLKLPRTRFQSTTHRLIISYTVLATVMPGLIRGAISDNEALCINEKTGFIPMLALSTLCERQEVRGGGGGGGGISITV